MIKNNLPDNWNVTISDGAADVVSITLCRQLNKLQKQLLQRQRTPVKPLQPVVFIIYFRNRRKCLTKPISQYDQTDCHCLVFHGA